VTGVQLSRLAVNVIHSLWTDNASFDILSQPTSNSLLVRAVNSEAGRVTEYDTAKQTDK
jgi:hypothetical protein